MVFAAEAAAAVEVGEFALRRGDPVVPLPAAPVCTVRETRSFEKCYFRLGMDSSSAFGLREQMR